MRTWSAPPCKMGICSTSVSDYNAPGAVQSPLSFPSRHVSGLLSSPLPFHKPSAPFRLCSTLNPFPMPVLHPTPLSVNDSDVHNSRRKWRGKRPPRLPRQAKRAVNNRIANFFSLNYAKGLSFHSFKAKRNRYISQTSVTVYSGKHFAKQKMGSGKSWTAEENVLACRAFVRASEHARHGVDQNNEVFNDPINVAFKRIQKQTTGADPKYARTGSALFEHYKKIKKECILFEGARQPVLAC